MKDKEKTKEQLINELAELRRRNGELRQSEERLSSLFELSKDGIVLIDCETGSIVDCNQEFVRLAGRSAEELKGMKIWETRPPDMVDAAREKFLEVREREEGGSDKLELRKPDGGTVPIWFRSRVLKINGKRHIQSICRDITERERDVQTLRESEERYRTVTEMAGDAIICMKEPGMIYMWNRRAEELFGYSAEETVGKGLHQLIVPERYREKAGEGMKVFFETGGGPVVGKTVELSALRKDGSEFPVELSISAMKTGGRWHTAGIIRDITERKVAEEALREKLDEIERMNRLMVGRELKMEELRKEIRRLKEKEV